MPIAAVALDFDPVLRLGDRIVRLDAIVLGLVLLGCLAVAARIARRTPLTGDGFDDGAGPYLRIDDLVFIVLAAVPGAVIGGRLGYVLLHPDFYLANPGAILDPGQGSLQLGLGVVGGTLSGAYAAWLLEQPVGRWLHVAVLPTLVAIAGGKLAQALGGAGQGRPAEVPWATSYVGPGPWGSLAPAIPSHPSQLYEAIGAAVVLVLLLVLLAGGMFPRRDGRAFALGIGAWLLARVAVAGTWRDPAVIGPLNADQLLSLAILAGGLIVGVVLRFRPVTVREPRTEPSWPDPETRPRF